VESTADDELKVTKKSEVNKRAEEVMTAKKQKTKKT